MTVKPSSFDKFLENSNFTQLDVSQYSVIAVEMMEMTDGVKKANKNTTYVAAAISAFDSIIYNSLQDGNKNIQSEFIVTQGW